MTIKNIVLTIHMITFHFCQQEMAFANVNGFQPFRVRSLQGFLARKAFHQQPRDSDIV